MAIELVHQFNFEYLPVENLNETAKNDIKCRQSKKKVRTKNEYEENVRSFISPSILFVLCMFCMYVTFILG